jgi:fatty-acyl-CoA synthase
MDSTIMDYPLTLAHLLERARLLFPGVEIVTRRPDKTLHRTTYAEFYRRARLLAQALREAGLRPGDRVATLSWNHAVHLECYYGVPCAGGILHTLNLRLAADEIAYIANHARDRFLIVDDVLLPLLAQFRDKVRFERIFVVRFGGGAVPPGMEDYEALLSAARGEFAYPAIGETDGCSMCYTSGTTGKSKGVIYSHRGMVLHSLVSCMADMLAISQNDCVLPVVPMFHANAWGLPYTATLAGAKLVFPGPHLDAESLLDLCEREQVSFSGGVPTVWMAILQNLESGQRKWRLRPQLRTLVGGSAAPPAMIERFDRLGICTLHGWGMTEMSPLGSVAVVKPHIARQGKDAAYKARFSQGLQAPFVDMRVVGDEGIAQWDGRSMGELQVRGPWVARSYYDFPEAQDRWTEDGWFKTGDVCTIDPEGYLQITDRTKDLIKSGGEWISSVDLENAIMGHPAVAEAAVIAVAHPKWVERPLACVVRKPGASVSETEIKKHLEGKFASWQLPDAIVFVEAIPRTSTGKFQKLALREQFKDFQWEERKAG